MAANKRSSRNWFMIFALIALTSFAYWQIKDHSFVRYDDDVYVVTNARVQRGLSWENVAWAFTSTSESNWHPLTWLSHMLDVQLFGMNPAGHHLTNLVLHLANVVLLFCVLQVITGSLWQSGLVAGLFAIHPINVESVAWVAERKNVLSTLFWMLTILAYVWHARRPVWNRYLAVLVSFALALMCKPMVVTLPFVLFLLDYWPLDRLKRDTRDASLPRTENPKKRSKQAEIKDTYPRRSIRQLAIEKAPLLLLSAASSAITLKAQQTGRALGTTEAFPLLIRFENAFVSYASYLLDTIWPLRLAVFYPHPQQSLPLWQFCAAALVLVAISAAAVWSAKKSRYITVGWFWYLGTLVPVIGLVQVGLQARADRYAYIPLVGIFIASVWFAGEWAKGRPSRQTCIMTIGACVVIALTVATRMQASYWQNSVTLFQRALAVTNNNYVAHNNLGDLLAQQGRFDEAGAQFAAALEINPSFAQARHNVGMMLVQRGKLEEAIAEFSRAVELDPSFTDAYNKLGAALASRGNLDEAIANFSKAIQIDPTYGSAHANLGSAYEQQGRTAEAIAAYSKALQFLADNTTAAQTHFKLGRLLARTGNKSDAVTHFQEALRLKSDYAPAQQALGSILSGTSR